MSKVKSKSTVPSSTKITTQAPKPILPPSSTLKSTLFIPTEMIHSNTGDNMEYSKSYKPCGLTHCMNRAEKKAKKKPKINYKKMFG